MAHGGTDDEAAAVAESLGDLSRLSAWVAHEINNPLAGIQNAFALIRGLVPEDHRHFKYVGAIEREIARIAALTYRLHQTYHYVDEPAAPTSLARVTADAIRVLEPLAQARGATVEIDIAASASAAVLSGGLLRAVVRHLLQHAIETAPSRTQIRIRVWRDEHQLWIAVPDFPPNELERRRDAAGPPGQALELVRRLAQALGGAVTRVPDNPQPGEICVGLPNIAVAKEPA